MKEATGGPGVGGTLLTTTMGLSSLMEMLCSELSSMVASHHVCIVRLKCGECHGDEFYIYLILVV